MAHDNECGNHAFKQHITKQVLAGTFLFTLCGKFKKDEVDEQCARIDV